MFKIVLFLFIFINTAMGDQLFDKIENLIGQDTLKQHNKLIQLVFKNKEKFYKTKTQLNYKLILRTLRNKGLLHLKFKSPKSFNIEFLTNTDAIKSLKILNETLRAMGYYYYFTISSTYNNEKGAMKWVISFKTEYALDPYLLTEELRLKSCKVLDITKINSTYWKYTLDVNNAKIREAVKVDKGEKVIFQKPLRPYFIEVTNATKLQVIGRNLNHWFPYIAFYDKHLNVLKVIKKDRVYKGYITNVPRETKYIKITDLYTLINIKRGLSIIIK